MCRPSRLTVPGAKTSGIPFEESRRLSLPAEMDEAERANAKVARKDGLQSQPPGGQQTDDMGMRNYNRGPASPVARVMDEAVDTRNHGLQRFAVGNGIGPHLPTR